MSKIKTDKYTIVEAFQQCFYLVPDYQREFVWTEKEVQQLLADIDDQFGTSPDNEYFVGMVLVSPGASRNHFEVIDGQQRLTTFFLLLCALRHRFGHSVVHMQQISGLISASYTDPSGEVRTDLKLEPRYEHADELMKLLVEVNNTPEKVAHAVQQSGIPRFGSLDNLLEAYATAYRYLMDNYDDEQDLKKLWGFLSNSVVFIQISTDISSALKIFETVNERGIGLNPMDLLKNLLFTQVNESDFTKLRSAWKDITAPLERAEEKPLRFLRYFLMANYKIRNKDQIVREDEIYDWFVDKENAADCGYGAKPFEFVRKIVGNVESYLGFASGRGNDGNPSTPMANLKKLCGGAFSLHYVLLLAIKDFPKPLFDHFVIQLESFLFYYIFTKTPTRELERNFSVWADELRTISDLGGDVAKKAALNEFIRTRFEVSMAAKSAELSDALRRYTVKSMQQYRTRYFLAKLTQFVDMAYSGNKNVGLLDDYMVLELEHILPNSPKVELRNSFAELNPGAEYDEYKNRLGNFTLLEKPINIVAGNEFFETKKVLYLASKHYLTASISELRYVGMNSSINRINDHLKSFNDWSAASIDARQVMLANLAGEVWRISLVDVET